MKCTERKARKDENGHSNIETKTRLFDAVGLQ